MVNGWEGKVGEGESWIVEGGDGGEWGSWGLIPKGHGFAGIRRCFSIIQASSLRVSVELFMLCTCISLPFYFSPLLFLFSLFPTVAQTKRVSNSLMFHVGPVGYKYTPKGVTLLGSGIGINSLDPDDFFFFFALSFLFLRSVSSFVVSNE